MKKVRVGVVGALGKMGKEVIKAVNNTENMETVLGVDEKLATGQSYVGNLVMYNSVSEALRSENVDVMVDFTNAEAFRKNAPLVLKEGVRLVSGTTGLNHDELINFGTIAKERGTCFFHAANFAIGAVLMMRFAEEAAKYMPEVEIIERHHDHKKDAPSGTAITTLKRIAKVREAHGQGFPGEFETIANSRGGEYEGMRVHSVRLPGYNAHQEVIFGGLGQTLVIRHDSINRESFMPGVILAINETQEMVGFVEDLESIM